MTLSSLRNNSGLLTSELSLQCPDCLVLFLLLFLSFLLLLFFFFLYFSSFFFVVLVTISLPSPFVFIFVLWLSSSSSSHLLLCGLACFFFMLRSRAQSFSKRPTTWLMSNQRRKKTYNNRYFKDNPGTPSVELKMSMQNFEK